MKGTDPVSRAFLVKRKKILRHVPPPSTNASRGEHFHAAAAELHGLNLQSNVISLSDRLQDFSVLLRTEIQTTLHSQ